MYFPYLRGKQFELLALRELTSLPLDGSKVSPIIEPLKTDTKSVVTMIRQMPKTVQLQIIINPEHGDLKSDSNAIAELIQNLHLSNYINVIPSFIISNNNDLPRLNALFERYSFGNSGYSLIHLNQIAKINELKELVANTNCIYNVISISHIMSLRRNFPKKTLAYLIDPFIRQIKNADYTNITDENFSNDHLYYKEEGFVGYGDYLTIGSGFIDGGRLPWAVAIHLTYLDRDGENIRIGHFVSDSNFDDSDTAGKFGEALDKLITFIDDRDIHTIATRIFRDLHNRGAFPGLGTIKKLSIMHHIELVQSLL